MFVLFILLKSYHKACKGNHDGKGHRTHDSCDAHETRCTYGIDAVQLAEDRNHRCAGESSHDSTEDNVEIGNSHKLQAHAYDGGDDDKLQKAIIIFIVTGVISLCGYLVYLYIQKRHAKNKSLEEEKNETV